MAKKSEELMHTVHDVVKAEVMDDNIVQCTSHGITVEVDKRRLSDARVYFLLNRVQNKRYSEAKQMDAYSQLMDLIFGDALDIADQLADANDGFISYNDYNSFFSDILDQVGAKNS